MKYDARFERDSSQSPRNKVLKKNTRRDKNAKKSVKSVGSTSLKLSQNLLKTLNFILSQFVAKPDIKRLYLVWVVLMLSGVGLALNLARLQILQGTELKRLAQDQQLTKSRPFVPRRTIIDRNGDMLALDRPVFTLYAHPTLFKESKDAIAAKLAPTLIQGTIFAKTPAELLSLFNKAPSGLKVAESLPEEISDNIKNLMLDGLELLPSQQRIYPQQELASEVVGYVDGDRNGQAGVEYSQQNLLERTMPTLRYQRAMNGAWIPEKLATGFVQFDDLKMQLTLDSRLQRLAREAVRQQMEKFKAKRGTVIVMDSWNGELLSLVSEPTYDPNQYYNFSLDRFKNWALTDVYEPGSTFKAINVAIALEAGVIKPDSVFNDEGRIFVDGWPIANYDYEQAGGRGATTVRDILKYSSNVGMVHIIKKMNASDYYNALQRLGLGQTTGSDLPFEVPSQMKNRQQFVSSPVEAATTAFGQGFSLTPLQMVQLMGSLANGGKLVIPHIVRGLFNTQGEAFWEPNYPEPQKVFSPETSQKVIEMMESVVHDGTGKAAKIPGYRIGGKTGTAQKAKDGVYSKAIVTSFVGIMPVDKPRYVVLAVFDEPQGGSGGVVAAPVVKSVIESLISIEKIPPSNIDEVQQQKEAEKP
ncbi:MAG: hypothetical protein RLZZ338_972 [Cyanobacteriota bacterium]|jgi:cell division protein FtsI (penicillin-binding protein 3)